MAFKVTSGFDLKRDVQFVVCIKNKDYSASLELRKLYQVLPDSTAEKLEQIRVTDESGEDYLFPESYFAPVQLPQALKRQFGGHDNVPGLHFAWTSCPCTSSKEPGTQHFYYLGLTAAQTQTPSAIRSSCRSRMGKAARMLSPHIVFPLPRSSQCLLRLGRLY